MSIKKNNTYFKENDGKLYYYDDNGIKKDVPSTAFSDLQKQIDNLGSPLTYSGAISVHDVNELETIKTGTVYTITGESGIITAGNVTVKQGDEIAWGGDPEQWFNIGKDIDNSWKQWSEDNGSISLSTGRNNVYIGSNNTISGDNNTVIGENNSANDPSQRNYVFGKTNEVEGYDNTIVGQSNKVKNANHDLYVVGSNNTLSGGYGNNLVFGTNNSAGDSTIIIGNNNSTEAGGGTFGYNNLGGKGGYIIGDNNISRKYEIINPTDPSRSAINYETAGIDNFWSQNVFGLYNYTQFKKNGGGNHGMPFQFGYNNIVQDEITWNSDYDTDTARTYHNGSTYIGTFNIGTNNSAFDTGINIGYKNTILIGDESGASINIGKGNVNRMGIIIGQGNVTYDTLPVSSTSTKSNAYSWILGQGNSANGASIAVGKWSLAQQGSYAFGNGLSAYSGSMSIGLHGLYTECGGIAIGNGASAYSGSLVIGCGGLYASAAGFAFGNNVTSYRGSIGIGKNSVYVADNGYALGEFVTAGSNAVAIGLSTYATGHGYAFGNQVTGQYAGIAVGFDGVTAGGQGASFGYYGAYSDGGSITLGHNGITSHATAVALGSNGLYSDFRSIAIGQFGVTATSAGLTIGNENVYSTDRAIAIGKYDVGARGWGSFAIGIKGITADNTSWSIGYGGYGGSNYLSAHISATNESYSLGQSGVSSCNNSFTIGRKNILASNESFVLGQRYIFAHDNSFNIGISGSDGSKSYSDLVYDWNYGTWSNSFAIGRGRNVAHFNSFILGIHNYSNLNLPYSADYNSIMLAVGDGLSSRTINDSISIASYGVYDGLSGKSTVEYQSLLLDHQVLGEVEVRNKSIMIGGPSFCQFHFNDVYSALSANVKEGSAKADHASIVLGYNNIADGGVFAIGSNNTACDLYGRQSAWTQFTQATIFGDYNRVINYRGYLYVPGVKEGQFSQSAFTRNAIIGTNNSISGWNNFIFGTNNSAGVEEYATHYPGDESPAYNDDGFTLAFGLNNRAVRNYDMAIGYLATASGGENIAIGTLQTDEYQYYSTATQAIGYCNFALRSNVSGTKNYAIDSILNVTYEDIYSEEDYTNEITKNILFNSKILGQTSSYGLNRNIFNNVQSLSINSDNFNRNLLSNFDGDNEYTFVGKWTNNKLENIGTFNINTTALHANYNIISNISNYSNSGINFTFREGSDNQFNFNEINNCCISGTFNDSFTHNFLFHSNVIGMNADTKFVNNVLFGSNVIDSFDTFSYSDNGGSQDNPLIINSRKIYNFGDNQVTSSWGAGFIGNQNNIGCAAQSFILGDQNTVGCGWNEPAEYESDYATRNFIFGCNNTVYSLTASPYLNNNYILGSQNECTTDKVLFDTLLVGNANKIIVTGSYEAYGAYVGRNKILGGYNRLNIDSYVLDNTLLGNQNNIAYFDTVPTTQNLIVDLREVDAHTLTSNSAAKAVYRNTIFGNKNLISQYIADSHIIGHANLIMTTNTADSGESAKFDSNYLFGNSNLSIDGSNQYALGFGNIVTGYNATAIGEGLIAKSSQMVVGRFNEEVDGTNGLSANGVDTTSGALFVIGNGKHIVDDYSTSAVVRSNAMIVSADGTVSARRFVEANPDTSLQELITLLHNKPATGGSKYIIGLDEQGALTWVPVTV